MTLYIQASHPRTLRPESVEARSLSSAISRLFAADTEDAVLTWNAIPVLLGYRYDLAVMAPELLDMLEACTAAPDGDHTASFASSSFTVQWRLSWRAGLLDITSQWLAIRGNYERLLAQHSKLSLPVAELLAEWKAPLELIVRAVDDAGVHLVDGDDSLDRLRRLTAAIPEYGKLYR